MKNITLTMTSTVRNAMENLEELHTGLSVVLKDDETVAGVLSDGDLRRALLRGVSMDNKISDFVTADYLSVLPDEPRAEVLDLMQAHGVRQMPIVDKNGRLHGIHTLSSILGSTPLTNRAVVMAGGKGTRLRPITENIPKPMVRVAGRPILERIILHLVSHGIRKIFLAVNYLSHMIEDYFEDGARFGCDIEYLQEVEPLGTGGALSLLPELPAEPVLVMNGDLVIQTDLRKMLDFHIEGSYFATMGLRPHTEKMSYGCADVEGNKIVALEEKPVFRKLINAGIYVLSPDAVKKIPKGKFYPITNLFEEALENNLFCAAYKIEDDWMDIGQPHHLHKANGLT